MSGGIRGIVLLLALGGSLAGPAWGGGPVRTWQASTQEEFAAGTLEGTAIEGDGRVRLALAEKSLWGPEQGIVWNVEPTDDDAVFVALSSPPRILRLSPGAPAVVWYEPAEEILLSAIVGDGRGGLYAGVSPAGALIHVSAPGRAEPAVETGAKFVWDLVRARDGSIWIAAGTPGTLLRYEPGGTLRKVFEGGEDPVRCVRELADGSIVFGTGGRGLVIRLDAREKPFVLHDADESEIVALEQGRDGSLYALAARAALQVGAASEAARAAAPVETVRVVASAAPDEGREESGDEAERAPTRTPPRRFATPPGGALYRLFPDGTVQQIWREERDVPFGLALDGEERLLVATGDRGRVYSLDPRGRAGLLLEIPSDQASAMTRTRRGMLILGGTTDARVLRLGPGVEPVGRYMTPAVDADSPADWGRLVWDADVPRGAELEVSVRGGNTEEPDHTWTDWMPIGGKKAAWGLVEIPPTRLLQARVQMRPGGDGVSPTLRRLQVFYSPRNRPPVIADVAVLPQGLVWAQSPTQSPRTGPQVATGPVVEDVLRQLQLGSAIQPIRKFYEQGARTVTWSARDPDGDSLRFRLDLRREGEEGWIPLANDVEDDFYSWDARGMQDGAYRTRLTAADAESNPAGMEHEDERISPVFEVDNTPPVLDDPGVRRRGKDWIVEFAARDPGGRVVAVEAARGDESWRPLAPVDGVPDSSEERYRIDVASDDDHGRSAVALRVRVSDAAGNVSGGAWVLNPGS